MKPLKKTKVTKVPGGGIASSKGKPKESVSPQYEERNRQQQEERAYFGPFFADLPALAIQNIARKWNKKGYGPEFSDEWGIKVINDAGFFPVCWDLDKDLYPLLRKQNDPKEKKMVEELVNNLKIELAKKYTILPPEEEPKEGETEAEKQARETREKKRYCFSKTRRDPKEGVGSLIDAATDGRELAIQGLLNAGVRVNAADSEGQTPLFFAAFNGHEACVARLLDAPGVQVNAASNDGLTPLYCAADNGHEACIARLLDAPGVQVNAADSDGWTPLHLAAHNGHEACVARLLKDPGVQVNAADNNGQTPLFYAKALTIKQMLEKAEKREKTSSSQSSSSSGGKPKTKPKVSKDYVTYTGKKYVVRVGSKGGKYILVGAEKKKVYVK